MQERARHVIIPSMWVWTERLPGGRLLRWLCVCTAVLAALVAGIAVFDQRAEADSYDPEELQFLELINDYRENNGLDSLALSDTLSVSAERHDQDMARYSFFAHNTADSSYYPVGSQPWDRMAAEGYDYNTYKGENIAVGYETAEQAFSAWQRSPSHNHAMLDGRYRVIGIARINAPDSVHGWYWTTDFGAVVDPSAHAPGESPQPADTNEQPAPETTDGRKEREEPDQDGPGVENGEMEGKAIWEQETENEAELILDGHARLGDYDKGMDDLSQKIRVGEDAELSYDVRIETNEQRHPSDRLLVRLTDRDGDQLAVLERYTDGDAGGWRHETVDLSDFAGRTVYLSFFVETDPMLRTAFYVDRVSLEERP
jgi:Cysteine-rich secretory protein family